MAELPLVGEEFAGYRLISVLGRSRMSIVFRAENPRLGNVIALKVLDPELASDDIFRARFLDESRIAASMNHPNVIPIHDMGSTEGLLYIAMRCVTGTDMRQMLKKRGRLQPDLAVYLLDQAARALDAAHRNGLVHRDVKPGNLLVERGNDGDDPDHLYLADFGITKHLGGRTGLTSTGAFLGTIDYVAPEQIRGVQVDGAADQYSLGCVLYECLTGHVPFEKDLDAAIMWAHVEEPPILPSVLRPDLPLATDDVFSRVLAKQPEDRYPTCRDFMIAARDSLGRMAEPPTQPTQAPPQASPPVPPQASPPVPPQTFPPVPPQALVPSAPPTLPRRKSGPMPPVPYPTELSVPVPLPLPVSYPAELAHEAADPFHAPTSQWPLTESAAVPAVAALPEPPGLPGQPGPPRPPGAGSGPERRPDGGRRRWLLLAAVFVLVAGIAAGVTVALRGGGGKTAGGAATPTMGAGMSSAAATPTASAGMSSSAGMATSTGMATSSGMGMTPAASTGTADSARTADCSPSGSEAATAAGKGQSGPTTLTGVQQGNLCSTPQGDIPASSCTTVSATFVNCTAPVTGVTAVSFETYASLGQLYALYQQEVTQLSGRGYTQNTSTRCGTNVGGYAETGWNHVEAHPTDYTVTQMESASFDQLDAMGRQACFIVGGKSYLIWTTDVGKMLAVAQGSSMAALYTWWSQVHHVLLFPGTEMCGATMDHMAAAPQGNLISIPVCPAGADPAGGM